jgi:hypothetical protein
MFIKPDSKQPQSSVAPRIKTMKFTICLLLGIFFLLVMAPANHTSAAMDKEAKIVFAVG